MSKIVSVNPEPYLQSHLSRENHQYFGRGTAKEWKTALKGRSPLGRRVLAHVRERMGWLNLLGLTLEDRLKYFLARKEKKRGLGGAPAGVDREREEKTQTPPPPPRRTP